METLTTAHRYSCSCGWSGNDTDVALYHSIVQGHQTEITHPEIPWRTEYSCGCWYKSNETHHCNMHSSATLGWERDALAKKDALFGAVNAEAIIITKPSRDTP